MRDFNELFDANGNLRLPGPNRSDRKSKIKNQKSKSAPLPEFVWDDDEGPEVEVRSLEPVPELIRLSEWDDRPIEWLWAGMIPLRKVTLLVGDPEQGKTFFALDLAARLSRGFSIPPDPHSWEPAGVLILSADDELDDTLVPGCWRGRTWLHLPLTNDGPRHGEGRPQISLARSVDDRWAAVDRGCRLIVIIRSRRF
jgi:hypothetical protein